MAREPVATRSLPPAREEAPGAKELAVPPEQPDAGQVPASEETARFAHPVVPRTRTRAMILMYHSIDDRRWRRSVPPHIFDQQLTLLRDSGVEIVRLSELVAFLEGTLELPEHVAVITIDDSEALFYPVAFPILVKHRAPFALGLVSDWLGRPYTGAMTWEQIREIVDSGLCEVANHSHRHRALPQVPHRELDLELIHSRDRIEEETGLRPIAFIYPDGAYDQHIIRRVEAAGYRAGFTVVGRTVFANSPRYAIPRFEVNRNTPLGAFRLWLRWGQPDPVAASP